MQFGENQEKEAYPRVPEVSTNSEKRHSAICIFLGVPKGRQIVAHHESGGNKFKS